MLKLKFIKTYHILLAIGLILFSLGLFFAPSHYIVLSPVAIINWCDSTLCTIGTFQSFSIFFGMVFIIMAVVYILFKSSPEEVQAKQAKQSVS